MPVFNNALAGAAGSGGAGAGYTIERSLRFNPDDGSHLSRTPSTAGNRRKFTVSCWVKRSSFDTHDHILMSVNSYFRFQSSGELIYYWNGSDAISTNAKFRDVGAWYNIQLVVDTELSNSADRIKFWVNGVQQPTTGTAPVQNIELAINNAAVHYIGAETSSVSTSTLDGYLADFHLLDGIAISNPDGVFGEFNADTGEWDPIQYTGDYNTALAKHQGGWESMTTGTGYNSSNSLDRAFDGNSSTGAAAQGGTAFVFTPSTPITGISKVRLRVQRDPQQFDDPDLKLNGANIGSNWSLGTTAEVEFTVNNLTSLLWATKSNGHWFKVYKIEIYYDNAYHTLLNANAGVNGFNLDFKDNASAAALGNDAAGSNNWTANNLQAQGSSNTFTVLGSISNAGSSSSLNVAALGAVTTTPATSWPADSNTYNHLTADFQSVGTYSIHADPFLSDPTANIIVFVSDNGTSWTTISKGQSPYNFSGRYIQWVRSGSGYGAQDLNADTRSGVDSLLDSPTNYDDSTNIGGNYATWNDLTKKGSVTTSNGALEANATNSGTGYVLSSIPVNSGKFYCEISFKGTMAHSTNYSYLGIVPTDNASLHVGNDIFRASGALSIDGDSSSYIRGNLGTGSGDQNVDYQTSYGFDENDIIGIAIDCDTPQVTFYKNGVSIGTFPHAMQAGKSWVVFVNDWANGADTEKYILNAGQRPFAHTPPSGFKAMCTQNLLDPLIKDPSTVFDVVTYTGDNNASRTITTGFGPDLVWLKSRNNVGGDYSHRLFDTVRGIDLGLSTNSTGNEENRYTATCGGVHAFSSTGFTLSQSGGNVPCHNATNNNMVAWAWDAGNDANPTSISAGSLNSTSYMNGTYATKWNDTSAPGSTASVGNGQQAFDGNLTTYANVATSNGFTKWKPNTPIQITSSLRLYASGISGGANQIAVNGTYFTVTNSPQWYTITGETYLVDIRLADTGSTGGRLWAVEVDGKILVDNNQTAPNVPSIPSTCRTNQTAGMSIVSYTGVGASGSASVAHNLNAEPDFMILKRRSGGGASWIVWWKAFGSSSGGDYFFFESNSKGDGGYDMWNSTSPTNSVFTISNNTHVNAQNDPFIGYIFSGVEGYSKFGRYQSSGATFVHTGFRPKMVIFKSVVGAHWIIMDTDRDIDNGMENHLHPNLNNGEAVAADRVDFLSNGFKLISNYGETNDGQVYYYAAFAESPFKYARAR